MKIERDSGRKKELKDDDEGVKGKNNLEAAALEHILA